MKKYVLIAVLLLTLLCTGCMPATQAEVKTLTGNVSTLLEAVDALQGTTSQMAADGLINKEKVDKINTSIDKVQETVVKVAKEVETAPDTMTAIEAGWEATKNINPWYVYGTMAIGVLKLLQKNKETNNSLEEIVLGVADIAKSNGGLTKEQKAAFNASESVATRRKVAKILA
ncbi:MAG: hypothetical protein MUO31_06560 [Thermodesulfovibrionales bacterium]|nr:hypothetical protein [Thermodesulfovibrionales bacterium]